MNSEQSTLPCPAREGSARGAAAAVRSGAMPARGVAAAVRAAIEAREPELRAWVALSDAIDADAAAVDRAIADRPAGLPLAGVCVGVKDLIDVAGLPTRAGSPITAGRVADTDAPCVARLRELGAVIAGKTVTTEFGYFAPGPTRNPHAPEHTPGGSSSGSAAAVGAGTIPLALGTQTAGSLTRPASYCGAAGMVLAHGTTDTRGITGLSPSLDSLGLLTRTVADLRFVFDAFAGPAGDADLDAIEVRVWTGSGLHPLAPGMEQLLHSLPALFAGIGIGAASLQRDDHIRTLTDDQMIVMGYEAARTRRRELDRIPEGLSPSLLTLLQGGAQISDDDYRAARTRRDRSQDVLRERLGTRSVIVGPAATGPAPAGLTATGSPVLSRAWQLLGCPVITVPGARDTDGLPLGLQVIGTAGGEAALFAVADALERSLRRAAA